MFKKILLGIIVLLAAVSARANDSLNVRTVGSWPFYSCRSVALDTSSAQKLVVLSVGGGLFIVDITDPLHPDKIGEINLNNSYSYILETNDRYAYCLSDSLGLSIVDYSNPHMPVLVGQCLFKEGKNQALAIIGNYVYACIDNYGIKIIDISDPTNPIEKNCFPSTYLSTAILTKDTLAYYAGDSLIVLNVSDPENPIQVGAGDTPSGDFAIRDTFLYGSSFAGINVYNISDPARPVCIGTGGNSNSGSKFTLYNSLIFSPSQFWNMPFYINSLSDPVAPAQISQCLTYCSRDIAAYNEYAYVADDREGMKVIDISDPANPSVVACCPMPEIILSEIIFNSDYIYLPAYSGGLRIIDVSNPSNLKETGCSFYPDKENGAREVIVKDTIAYVSDGSNGLRVLNIADSFHPVEVCSLSLNGYTCAIANKDTFLFIGSLPINGDSASIRVINVANPGALTEIGHICLPNEAIDISIKNDYLFVSIYHSILSTIDISDPSNPTTIYSNDTLGFGWYHCIKDSILYIASDTKGLSIINVADPMNPIKIASVPPFSHTTGIFVDSAFAYMSDDTLGLKVVNITDPSNPIVTGYYLFYFDPFYAPLAFRYCDLTADHNNIFITHPFDILNALEYYGPDAGVSSDNRDNEKKPTTFLLKEAYPNPARGKTNISYQLPNKAKVKLNLYNIAGQLISSNDLGTQQAGYYNLPVKTNDLSSGVYFYKLTAGNNGQTKKIVVLK